MDESSGSGYMELPMDPDTHSRFLDYLELWDRFRAQRIPKLDREGFVEFEDELERLETLQRSGELDALGARRIGAVRRMLLRD